MLNSAIYNVYKTSTGMYIPGSLCNTYNVGQSDDQKTIKGIICYKVTEEDINTINEESSKQEIQLSPNYISLFDLQLVLSFTVYKDTNHEDKLYILDSTCSKYGIEPISKRIINNFTYYNVTEEDISKIEEMTKNEKIVLKRKYEEISLEDEMKPADSLFMYYLDYETNKKYVNREIYELAKKNEIEIEGSPKIINNKNCYSITDEELKEIENKTGYRGVEQLIQKNIEQANYIDHVDIDINKVRERANEVINNLSLIENKITAPVNSFNPSDINTEIEPVKIDEGRIKEKLNELYGDKQLFEGYPTNIAYNQNQLETIIIYKDKKTDKLYAPFQVTDNQEQTMIMNKPCYEITPEELENINDKKLLFISVYPVRKKTYDVIICNNKDQLFISKKILDDLGFYIDNPHKILVNKEVYEEIAEEDIELIKAKESDSCHINIIEKQIAPKRG